MMIGWETDPSVAAQSPKSAEFARIWQRADKVVFSSTLQRLSHESGVSRGCLDWLKGWILLWGSTF
jgi:hypothetical protein